MTTSTSLTSEEILKQLTPPAPQPTSLNNTKPELVLVREGLTLTADWQCDHTPDHKQKVIQAVQKIALKNDAFMEAARKALSPNGTTPLSKKISFLLTVEDNLVYVRKPDDKEWKIVNDFKGSPAFRNEVCNTAFRIYDECLNQTEEENSRRHSSCDSHSHKRKNDDDDKENKPITIHNNNYGCCCCRHGHSHGSGSEPRSDAPPASIPRVKTIPVSSTSSGNSDDFADTQTIGVQATTSTASSGTQDGIGTEKYRRRLYRDGFAAMVQKEMQTVPALRLEVQSLKALANNQLRQLEEKDNRLADQQEKLGRYEQELLSQDELLRTYDDDYESLESIDRIHGEQAAKKEIEQYYIDTHKPGKFKLLETDALMEKGAYRRWQAELVQMRKSKEHEATIEAKPNVSTRELNYDIKGLTRTEIASLANDDKKMLEAYKANPVQFIQQISILLEKPYRYQYLRPEIVDGEVTDFKQKPFTNDELALIRNSMLLFYTALNDENTDDEILHELNGIFDKCASHIKTSPATNAQLIAWCKDELVKAIKEQDFLKAQLFISILNEHVGEIREKETRNNILHLIAIHGQDKEIIGSTATQINNNSEDIFNQLSRQLNNQGRSAGALLREKLGIAHNDEEQDGSSTHSQADDGIKASCGDPDDKSSDCGSTFRDDEPIRTKRSPAGNRDDFLKAKVTKSKASHLPSGWGSVKDLLAQFNNTERFDQHSSWYQLMQTSMEDIERIEQEIDGLMKDITKENSKEKEAALEKLEEKLLDDYGDLKSAMENYEAYLKSEALVEKNKEIIRGLLTQIDAQFEPIRKSLDEKRNQFRELIKQAQA